MLDKIGRQSSARRDAPLFALSICFGTLIACGGVAVIDPEGGSEAGGGFASVGSVSSSGVTTSSTGPGGSGGMGGDPRGGAPPIPPLVEHPQGPHGLGTPITFEVEPGTLGVTVTADIVGDLTTIGFEQVKAPNNATIVQNFGIPTTSQNYMWFGIDTLLLPGTDHPEVMPLMPGTWSFTLGSQDGPQTADVSIWTRHTLDGQFHGGVIDVNVYIAANAATQQYMTQTVNEAFDGWAGLSVGTISFHVLPSQFSVVTETTALDPFLETVDAAGKPALNVLVVSLIDFEAIGYSPGAPALPLMHGTRQSGVVMMPYDPGFDYFTLRHEAGHFGGLLHTSEFTPGLGDFLSDTPKCQDVEQQLQNCPDINYLMFPAANPGGLQQMSPKQDVVVQASALYRGAVEEGGGYAEPLDVMDNVAGESGSKSMLQQSERELADSAGIAMTLGRADTTTHWRVSVGEEVALFASSLWCNDGSPVDYPAVLRSLASVADLFALANDADAPDYVRMRALWALGGAQLSTSQEIAVADMATDSTLPRLVRLGAWRGIRRAAPTRALQIAPKLRLDRDHVVRAAAQ
jgi:hypothetical protein